VKILVAYPVTGARLALWAEARKVEHDYVSPRPWADIALITDHENEVPGRDVAHVMRGDLWTMVDGKRFFNLSVARNLALDLARMNGYDWLFAIDGDVLVMNRPAIFPESGMCVIPMAKQQGPHDSAHRIFDRFKVVGDKGLKFEASSQFMVGAKLFDRLRWCEGFAGYGFEDLDFKENVCARYNGIYEGTTNARALHLWHSLESRAIDDGQFARNRALYESRKVVA
jgi:hypothetical protein